MFEQKTGIDVNAKSFLQRRETAKDLGDVSVRTGETPYAAVAGDGGATRRKHYR